MTNETIINFNYPKTLLHEYKEWVVLLRPQQITLGSLVLAYKSEAIKLPEVSLSAYNELKTITTDIENVLVGLFNFDKINYLLLMMRDKYVHFHVIPRYGTTRKVFDVTFSDQSWPYPPDLSKSINLTDEQFIKLHELIKSKWSY